MKLELLNTLASIGTFVVIAVTAIAAMVQLRHMRGSNELQAVLALRSERTTELEAAFEYVVTELEERLKDPAYRDDLENNTAPSRIRHPELRLSDYFEHIGTYVRLGLVPQRVYFQIASPERYWRLVAPAIAIYRRKRSPSAFENFEWLAVRADHWDATHPHGDYPATTARYPLEDIYLKEDRPLSVHAPNGEN